MVLCTPQAPVKMIRAIPVQSHYHSTLQRRNLPQHVQRSLRAAPPHVASRPDSVSTVKPDEQKDLNIFRSMAEGQDLVEAAHALLLRAVRDRSEPPGKVLGAMLHLEQLSKELHLPADLLQKLVGPWRLVFSGPSKIEALSYIPVDEDFFIDAAASTLKLESDLGPLRAKFRGSFKWRPGDAEMDFAFNEAEVDLFGRTVWTRAVGFKEKTYSYFWQRDEVVCARSSGGTLTLMKRL